MLHPPSTAPHSTNLESDPTHVSKILQNTPNCILISNSPKKLVRVPPFSPKVAGWHPRPRPYTHIHARRAIRGEVNAPISGSHKTGRAAKALNLIQ